jgi:hypothetical protein
VTIPKSVKTIGAYILYKCININSLYFEGAPPRVQSDFTLGLDADTCIAYYLPSMKKKWGASFGGIPTAVNPL